MNRSNHLYLAGHSLLSALLLFLAWPATSMAPLMFVALIPLFRLDKILENPGKTGAFFGYVFLALFLFNASTTWWVWNASKGGAVFMLFFNSSMMILPFMAYRFTRRLLGTSRALTAFILFWLAFEYLHFRWELAFPWLTLGNGFANATSLVQWYEYTGVLGGSLWILLVNVAIYQLMRSPSIRRQVLPLVILIGPVIWSFYLGAQQNDCIQQNEIVVVQPNIDPYSKFNSGQELNQVRLFLDLAEREVTGHTELVVLPETAIVENLDLDYVNDFESIELLTQFIKGHPNLKILTGASTYRFYREGETLSATAREHGPSGQKYDAYNTALLIDSSGVVDVYHKSKLVPGTERMPYPRFFNFIKPLAIDLGGVNGSLGADTSSHVFRPYDDKRKLRPAALICYESIFGQYTASFVQKKANILFVITNDGWWGDTPGYRHHLHYARLRAIENRRYVVRSANTGISAVIDDNGEILYRTKWWEAIAFKAQVRPLSHTTFYMQHGDYLGRIAAFLSLFLLLSVWVKKRILR